MILLVDDYHDGAIALCKLLKHAGYPCRHADSGHEALALIRAHPPEQPLLVVLDDMMPEMNGISVLRAIRADPAIASRPVIFYSAGYDLEKRDESMALGALGWFLKGGSGLSAIDAFIDRVGEIYQGVGGVKILAQGD